jgi:hypothetical protein
MAEDTPAIDAGTGASRDPAARIQALSADLRAAEAVIVELKGRDLAGTVSTLEAAAAEHATAAEAFSAERTGWEAERAGWGRERALLSAGITSAEGQAVARALYHLQPEDGRPELGAWLTTAAASPPPALAPYLRGPAAPAAPAPQAAAPTNGATPPAPPPGVPIPPKGEPTPADRWQAEKEYLGAPRGPKRDAMRVRLDKIMSGG